MTNLFWITFQLTFAGTGEGRRDVIGKIICPPCKLPLASPFDYLHLPSNEKIIPDISPRPIQGVHINLLKFYDIVFQLEISTGKLYITSRVQTSRVAFLKSTQSLISFLSDFFQTIFLCRL